MANLAASVLAKLKNKSKEENISLQQLLNLFCQEEFIRRLSMSQYKEHLILKGGYLLYSMSGFKTRPTVDADYLLKNYSNDLSEVEKLVTDIISQPSENDFITIQIIGMGKASEIREYQGIRVNLLGIIGRTRTPFSIDFGVGDIIIPSSVERTLPVLLPEFENPTINTYSLESTVSEKLDAMISLMEANSRMKDFYDIYYLSSTFDFEGKKIQKAIYETLTNRSTPYDEDSIRIIARLAKNQVMQNRWKSFCTKILKYELDFNMVINKIIAFTSEPYSYIFKNEEFSKIWKHDKGQYISTLPIKLN